MSRLPKSTPPLPIGVSLRRLASEHRAESETTELYRRDWQMDVVPVQWNLVSSGSNTLRGVHVHTKHWDYLHVISGEMLLGLHDMRPQSPTYKLSAQQRLAGDRPSSIAIPPGVAHGFYFVTPTTYCYAVSHYWNPSDELGCRWNDPMLGLAWPATDVLLSPRDASAPGYEELARALIDQEFPLS